jgi:hypothetical protein
MSKVRSGTVSGLLDLNSLCAGVVTFAPAPNPLQIIPFWRSSKTRPSSLTTNWDLRSMDRIYDLRTINYLR